MSTACPASSEAFRGFRQAAVVLVFLIACSPVTPAPLEGAARQQAADEYGASISGEIQSRWKPKQAFRDYPNVTLAAGPLETVLWVLVDGEGDVISTDVAKSAGTYLDREAIRAVQVAGPFPPPPRGLLQRSSRGLVAGFPMQFIVQVPGEPGTYVQARTFAASATPSTLRPVR